MNTDGERNLWKKVVIQAIEDYISVTKTKKAPLRKEEAIEWFNSNSSDYKEVCDNAGIAPEWLRKVVLNSDITKLRKLINEYRRLM